MVKIKEKNSTTLEKIKFHSSVTSVLALLAKSTFGKIGVVMALMTVTEGILFYCKKEAFYRPQNNMYYDLDRLFILVRPLFLAALGLIFFILIRAEGMLNREARYTTMRLGITQGHFFVVKTVYNMLCLAALFAVQIWVAVGILWQLGSKMEVGDGAPQFLFLAFYGNQFLHCLLPMAETGKWVRNFLLVLAFGMESAGTTEKKSHVIPICLFNVTAFWFVSDMGVNLLDVASDIVYFIIVVVALIRVKKWEKP